MAFNRFPPSLKVTDAGLKRDAWREQLLSVGQESVQKRQSKLEEEERFTSKLERRQNL